MHRRLNTASIRIQSLHLCRIYSPHLLPGYETAVVSGTELFSRQLSFQTVTLRPSGSENSRNIIVIPAHTLYGNYPPKIAESEVKPITSSGEIVLDRVVVPEYVVVHDGTPRDSTAGDYYVKYKDYIKNVASSEIYATWPMRRWLQTFSQLNRSQ